MQHTLMFYVWKYDGDQMLRYKVIGKFHVIFDHPTYQPSSEVTRPVLKRTRTSSRVNARSVKSIWCLHVLTLCWLEWVFHVVFYSIVSYLLYTVVDQLPRLGKRELVFLLLFTCSFVISVSWRFLFLLALGMGCAFLLWHSLGLPFYSNRGIK